MKFLKNAFQFYIFSNIHVALAVSCLVKITLLEHDIHENYTVLFVFFSTIVAYNLIRFFRFSDLPRWIRTWLKGHQKILYALTGISSIAVLFLIFQIRFKALLWLIPFGVFTIFYGLPLPFKNSPLRKVPGVKIFLIAISFAGISVLFPILQNDIIINSHVWITFFQRFFFVILITIPFDIRDLHNDLESLKTIPQTFGIIKAKLIGILFGLLFLFMEFLKSDLESNAMIIALIVSVISLSFLIGSKEKQAKYYSSFYVEAIPISWFLIFLIVK